MVGTQFAPGAVYVFERSSGETWSETKVDLDALEYTDVTGETFGTSVAADGSRVAIGGFNMTPQAFVIDSPVVAPEPIDDSYSTLEDTPLSAAAGADAPDPAGVLDNDVDPGGAGLTALLTECRPRDTDFRARWFVRLRPRAELQRHRRL